jgi:F-type H+-transporting ATPase subunit delta
MTNVRVARRYAEALVEIAEAGKTIDATIKDLEFLKASIQASHDLLLFLKNPIISRSRKRDILRVLFADKIQKSTIESIGFIAIKGREELLPEIIDQFLKIWDDRQGIVGVEVKTASEFSSEQTAILRGKLEHYTHKKTRIAFGRDAQLIGGFVARVGDTVFDGSARRQLERLRQRLSQDIGTN